MLTLTPNPNPEPTPNQGWSGVGRAVVQVVKEDSAETTRLAAVRDLVRVRVRVSASRRGAGS